MSGTSWSPEFSLFFQLFNIDIHVKGQHLQERNYFNLVAISVIIHYFTLPITVFCVYLLNLLLQMLQLQEEISA